MSYIFGVFEFDAGTLELRKSGRLVALEPQPARALGLLLERAGHTVSRDELTAHVWDAGTHVDFDRGLTYCISRIRIALGDSGESPRFVQTLPKRGFKFIASVTRQPAMEPAASDSARPQAAERRSLPTLQIAVGAAALLLVAFAVEPFAERAIQRWRRPVVAVSIFDNETGDSRYDRTVHALSDAVVDRLTTLGPSAIGIVGNASILRVPRSERDLDRIEEQTGASHAILAQLQPSKGDLSLLMQIIRLDDGTHVWVRRIARPAADSLDGLDEEAARLIESGVRQHVLGSAANP